MQDNWNRIELLLENIKPWGLVFYPVVENGTHPMFKVGIHPIGSYIYYAVEGTSWEACIENALLTVKSGKYPGVEGMSVDGTVEAKNL